MVNILKKHKILITGSGSGLGKMAAISLAKRGHIVYATTFYENQTQELNKYAKENNLNLTSFKLDIRDKSDLEKLNNIEYDTLINNAAIGDSGSLSEVNINRIKNVFNTNIFATLNITQLAIKKFIENKKGKVIFISSLSGRTAIKFLGPYCTTKFCLQGIAECLKKEMKMLEYADIKIKLIEPGAYATGFNKINTAKKYKWMEQKSYFKFRLDSLKENEEMTWNFLESKNFKPIIKQYVKAVEDNNYKFRYCRPFIQKLAIKILLLFS